MIVQRYAYATSEFSWSLHSQRTIVLQPSVVSNDLWYSVCFT